MGTQRSSDTDRDRAKPPLTLSLHLRFHARWTGRKRTFHFGPRPDGGKGAMTQRAWTRHIHSQSKGNPIHIADRFVARYALPSVATYAEVAAHFGVTSATVSHYVALVERLPEKFVKWLREVNDAAQLRRLTERRLRPIARIDDEDVQRERLEVLVETPA